MEHVFVIDPNDKRLETIEKLGGIGLRGNVEQRNEAVKALCPRGVDIVVHVTSAASVLGEGVNLLRNGGHYAFSGMVTPNSGLADLRGDQIVRKCLTVRGVHNYSPYHLSASLEFLNKGIQKDNIPFDLLHNNELFKIEEINEAFRVATTGDVNRVTIDLKDA